MRTQRTTGLTVEQFADLCALVRSELEPWDSGRGRPRALSLGQSVKVTAMYYKNNVTEEFLGELLGVSQPTISRTINRIEPIIADVLDAYVPDPQEVPDGLVVLVDGTLAPCWSWADAPELFSGKHKTTGHNHQVGASMTGRLLFLTDPLPGKTHDARAFRETKLNDTLDTANSIADKGDLGSGTGSLRSHIVRPSSCSASAG